MAWTRIGLYVCLGLTAVCVFGYLGETITGGGGGGGYDESAPVYMLCANPECNAALEITMEEFVEMGQEQGDPMMMMMGPMVYECPDCSKKSLYRATKCEECGEIFVENYQSVEDYPDRCPSCGYSAIEERSK